jgi:hypothetical protein
MLRHATVVALAIVLFAIAATPLAQGGEQAPQAQQLFAQKVAQLGACNAELGQLQQMQAAVIGGQLVDAAKFREAFERVNPGKTLAADLKVMDKAANVPPASHD